MFIVKVDDEIVSKAPFLHYERYNERIGDFFSSDREHGDRVCVELDEEGEPREDSFYANYDGKVFDQSYPIAEISEVVEDNN